MIEFRCATCGGGAQPDYSGRPGETSSVSYSHRPPFLDAGHPVVLERIEHEVDLDAMLADIRSGKLDLK